MNYAIPAITFII